MSRLRCQLGYIDLLGPVNRVLDVGADPHWNGHVWRGHTLVGHAQTRGQYTQSDSQRGGNAACWPPLLWQLVHCWQRFVFMYCSGVSRIWRQGGLEDVSPPAGSRGRAPGGGVGKRSPRELIPHYGIRIFGCRTMRNFVYLGKVHEPLVKHEKNLGCSACFVYRVVKSLQYKYFKYVIKYMTCILYFIQF